MSEIYAMQRANGDWFAFDDDGRLRVPVFRNSRDAMHARMRNAGMLLFKPVVIDERAIADMAPGDGDSSVDFWLVDKHAADVNRGHLTERTHLSRIVRDAVDQMRIAANG